MKYKKFIVSFIHEFPNGTEFTEEQLLSVLNLPVLKPGDSYGFSVTGLNEKPPEIEFTEQDRELAKGMQILL